ncbi:MAG TPA: hypothetical protein VN249_02550, partial [Prolixibacteraceae bacterium]|nr:hypothetical protein [Prolixibacteraceae bacterium]
MRRLIMSLLMGFGAFLPSFSAPENMKDQLSAASGKFPDADYFTIFDSTKVDMQESGLSFYREHRLIKIQTISGGKQFNVFRFDYDPLSAYAEIQKVI